MTPDPLPHTGNAPITYGAYSYETALVRHGKIVPGFIFVCHVPVKGKRHCVLFRR